MIYTIIEVIFALITLAFLIVLVFESRMKDKDRE